MPTLNRELAATILVEAAYKGDKAAALHWGVSRRTVRNWRARLLTDGELAALFQVKRAVAEKNWAEDAPMALRAALAFIQRAAQDGLTVSAGTVHAVAGAMKLVADMLLTKQVLDARLVATNRPEDGRHREMVAAGDFSAN